MENNQQIPPVDNQLPVKTASNLTFFKTLAYGFVVVSIGISIAVGGYLLGTNKSKPQPIAQVSASPTPTPLPVEASAKAGDPTATWKTYADKTYNFSIQYPDNWTQATTPDPYKPLLSVISFSLLSPKGSGTMYAITIEVFPNPNRLNSWEYISTEAFKNDLPGWDNNKQHATSVSSTVDAQKIDNLIGGAGPLGPVVFISSIPAGTNMIKVSWIPTQFETDSSIFDKVVSTFKFTP